LFKLLEETVKSEPVLRMDEMTMQVMWEESRRYE
jgi:hypothetical protein